MATFEKAIKVAHSTRCGPADTVACATKCYLQRAKAKYCSVSIRLRSHSTTSVFQNRGSTRQRQKKRLDVQALVVFDYAQPALWLGTALIGGGVSLYNLRNVQPLIAKDSDVALSCILVFSGGILIFQGWRLDPLLLFVQICLAGTAFTWALEAIKLRKEVDQGEYFGGRSRATPEIEDSRRRDRSFAPARNRLPAGAQETDYGQWYGEGEREEEFDFEEAVPASSRGFYGGRGHASSPSPSGRYQSYDPAEYRSYSKQSGYPDYPEEEGPSGYRNYDQGYDSQERQQEFTQGYARQGNEDWEVRGPSGMAQQQGFREEPGGVSYTQDQQIFDIYSQQESDFLPSDGEAVVEDDQATNNSRVMDEVASFYNRPESVVEDVQKFYDDRGQRTEGALEDLEEQILEEQDVNNGNQGYEEEWQTQKANNDSLRQTGEPYTRQNQPYNEQQPRYRQRT